jgi:hypothetical protein
MEGERVRARMAVVVATVLLAVLVVGPARTYGTSYDPLAHGEEGLAPGDTVFLFHGGTDEARRSLAVGEVLVVSRPGEDGVSRVAGKIRVAAPAGAFCLRGEVLEGSVRVHDLAAREGQGVYSLVVPESVCGR